MNIKELFNQGEKLIQEGLFDKATDLYEQIFYNSKIEKERLWAKKHIADIIGYCGYKDYSRATELYKEIIEEAVSYPDLIKWCKIDSKRSQKEIRHTRRRIQKANRSTNTKAHQMGKIKMG